MGDREEDRVGERKIETPAGVGEREKDSSTDRSAGDKQGGREREDRNTDRSGGERERE